MRVRGAATEWRVTARLARREVRRRPWRTALVLLLIGLPVAGMTLYVIGARTTTPTVMEQRTRQLGEADDAVSVLDRGDGPPDEAAFDTALAAAYPPGSRFVTYENTQGAVTRADGHLENISLTNRPLDDPLLDGTMPLVEGRAPRASDEIAINRTVASLTDAEVGSTVELFLLGEKQVTGIVVQPGCTTACPTVVTPDPLTHRPASSRHAFVDAPPSFTAANWTPLNTISARAEISPQGVFNPDGHLVLAQRQAAIYLVGVGVLAVVAVITIAAFAVATRRQLRTLGLLSASGVPPTGLRRVVLLQGTSAGVLGSGLGVLLGVVLARVLFRYFDDVSGEYVTGLNVHPLDLLGPFVLGVLAATVAAWWPARSVAKIPTLAALAGRQPQDRLPARTPIVGIVALVLGIAGLAWSLRGSVGVRFVIGAPSVLAVLLGGVATGPWLVSRAEPLSQVLRGGARVALRDLARQRMRSGAVVAAIMAPAGVLALVVTTSATQDARNRAAYDLDADSPNMVQDNQLLLQPAGGWATGQKAPDDQLEQLRAILPDAVEEDIHVVLPQQPTSTGFPGATVRVVDSSTGVPVAEGMDGSGRYLVTVDPARLADAGRPPEVVDALEKGKIVVSGVNMEDPTFVLDGITAPFDLASDVVVIDLPGPRGNQVAAVSPATVEGWGASTIYYGTLYETPDPLASSQRRRIHDLFSDEDCPETGAACRDALIRADLLGQSSTTDEGWFVDVSPGQVTIDNHRLLRYGYSGALLAFTLLVLAVALALTAAESRDERALLDAVGAPPSVRRSITAWQAGLLPAIAMVVAIPGGVAVARVTDPYGWEAADPFVIPFLELAVGAVGIPLVAVAVAWVTSSLSGLRRRDLSGLALAED